MDYNSFEGMQEQARQGDPRFQHLLPQYEQQNQDWSQQGQPTQQNSTQWTGKQQSKNSTTTPYLSPTPSDPAQEFFIEGNRYAQAKNWQQAITYYTKAIELNPNHAEAYHHRGNIYANQERIHLALGDYSRGISLNPYRETLLKLYLSRGKLYFFNFSNLDKPKYLENAIDDFSSAISLNTWQYIKADAYYFRGCAYAELNQTKEAISDYAQGIKLYSKFLDYKSLRSYCHSGIACSHFHQGRLFQQLKKHRDAIQNFDLALQIHNKNPQSNVLYPEYLNLIEYYTKESYKNIPAALRPFVKIRVPKVTDLLQGLCRIVWIGTTRLVLIGGVLWVADTFLLNQAIQKKAVESLPVVLSVADRVLPTLPYNSLKNVTIPNTRVKVIAPYQQLESFLADGKWEAANNETMNVLLVVSKSLATSQFDESTKSKACESVKQINYLWEYYSSGHFGFKAQYQVYTRSVSQFPERVGWVKDGNSYPLTILLFMQEKAPKGMLPAIWAANCPTCVQTLSVNYSQLMSDCQL
jgi:tetratricopeptide (TPR) repeat protein